MKTVLKAIDFAAMGVALFGIVAAVILASVGTLRGGVANQIRFEWENEKAIVLAILFGLVWCFLRSNQLNER